MIEEIRRPYRKQERIVDYGDDDQAYDRDQYDLVHLVEPVQIEYVEADVQIEQRILKAEIRRVLRFQEGQPCARRRVERDTQGENDREYPRSGIDPFQIRYLMRLDLLEIAALEGAQIEPGEQRHDDEYRHSEFELREQSLPEYTCVAEVLEPHPVGYESDQSNERGQYDGNEHDGKRQSLAALSAFASEFVFFFLLSFWFLSGGIFCQSFFPPGVKPVDIVLLK